jgi:hypothetical protein
VRAETERRVDMEDDMVQVHEDDDLEAQYEQLVRTAHSVPCSSKCAERVNAHPVVGLVHSASRCPDFASDHPRWAVARGAPTIAWGPRRH